MASRILELVLLVELRCDVCDEIGRSSGFLEGAIMLVLLREGSRPLRLRRLLGAVEAICNKVVARCNPGWDGMTGRELLEALGGWCGLGTIKPYRSISSPLISCQSSMPPANSCSSLTKKLSRLLLRDDALSLNRP